MSRFKFINEITLTMEEMLDEQLKLKFNPKERILTKAEDQLCEIPGYVCLNETEGFGGEYVIEVQFRRSLNFSESQRVYKTFPKDYLVTIKEI